MDLHMELAMAVQSVGVGGDVVEVELDSCVMVVMLGAQTRILVIISVIRLYFRQVVVIMKFLKKYFISDIRILSEIFRC